MNGIKILLCCVDDVEKAILAINNAAWSKDVPYIVEIKRFERSRSLAQNNLLHMWLAIIAKETGNTLDAVKTEAKRRILGVRLVEYTNHKTKEKSITAVIPSINELTVKEMTVLLNGVEEIANELGIVLPFPEDLVWSIKGEYHGDK